MTLCRCEFRDKENDETQREWLKDCMCMFHWMQTDYYQEKLGLERNIMQDELLDLIKLMPDSQTQVIVDFIMDMRAIRKHHADTKTDTE